MNPTPHEPPGPRALPLALDPGLPDGHPGFRGWSNPSPSMWLNPSLPCGSSDQKIRGAGLIVFLVMVRPFPWLPGLPVLGPGVWYLARLVIFFVKPFPFVPGGRGHRRKGTSLQVRGPAGETWTELSGEWSDNPRSKKTSKTIPIHH